jgi:hypothetical protein
MEDVKEIPSALSQQDIFVPIGTLININADPNQTTHEFTTSKNKVLWDSI